MTQGLYEYHVDKETKVIKIRFVLAVQKHLKMHSMHL